MVIILLPPGNDSEKTACALFELLQRSRHAMLLCDALCHFADGNPDFCIVMCGAGQQVVLDAAARCIVLVPEGCQSPFVAPPGATVLSFSESGPSIALDGSQQLISCGLRQRDTLTLSSLDSQKPVFSVQRTVTTLNGESLEIGEYPLSIPDEQKHQDIIAAAAVLLLQDGYLEPDCFRTH
ncbi:hypothetical protein ACS3UN_08910 [Oscillospiraceae bacterium LTW-04]|nr:hypothetical protein RBH76_10670 [Oscillospiraceae bacterium MB24-C1]